MADDNVTDVRFYHMEVRGLDQTLPALLNKALQGGHKVLVRAASTAEAERLNAHLWSYDPASFIPHGSKKDGQADKQPVYLSAEGGNPNDAGVLVLTGGVVADDVDQFAMVCEMLNGRDEQAVAEARARWKDYKASGHEVTYWQQTQSGGWDKKA